MAIVFLDESGDTGFKFEAGSSRLFVASVVGFDSVVEYQKSEASLAQFRADFHLPSDYEIKFSKMNHERRLAAIKAAVNGEFWFYSFVLNKPRLWSGALRQKNAVYHKVCVWLFENALTHLSDSRIILDRCGNRDMYDALQRELHDRCEAANRPFPKSFDAEDSRNSAGLQIADLVSATVNRWYSAKPKAPDLYRVLGPRAKSVRYWP